MRTAVRASPRSTAFVALAHALCDAGLPAEAEVVSRQGLAHHPELPTGHVVLARAWLEGGTPARAERALRQTIRLHPRHADAYRWLAETLIRTGRSAEAADIWPRTQAAAPPAPALPASFRTLVEQAELAAAPPVLAPAPARAPTPEPDRRMALYRADGGEEPTPTGSFPPISVTHDAMRAVELHQQRRWMLWGFAVSMFLGAGALGAFYATRHDAPSATERAARSPADVDIEGFLRTGSLRRLLRARALATAELSARPDDRALKIKLGSAHALLAFFHGVAAPADQLASLLAPSSESSRSDSPVGPFDTLDGQGEAAGTLLALASGELEQAARRSDRAASLAPEDPLVVAAAAAVRHRRGDVAGAVTTIEQRPGPATGGPSGPLRLLLATAHLDRGDAAAALSALGPLLGDQGDESEDAGALLLAAEAARAGASGAWPGRATLTAACGRESSLSPAVAAGCLLDAAIAARLDGDRADALGKVRRVLAPAATQPRVLATAAQLLANLGRIDEAASTLSAAARLAARSLPALAWADVAVQNGRGDTVRLPPALRALGSESRLIAARVAVASGGDISADGSRDPDLRWLARLTRPMTPRQAVTFAHRLERQPDPGPVGAYVVGMIARAANRRHLAERWLARALAGHGDSCRAAREYATTLRQLRRRDAATALRSTIAVDNRRCQVR